MIEFLIPMLWLMGGFAVLILGGELLVRGATALATAWSVPPLLIGLTVVAFGTSAPELAVTIQSSMAGECSLALGNVVGSNICNVLLVLGTSALVAPLVVSAPLVRRDVPVMLLASLLLIALSLDGKIGRWDGLLLTGGLLVYTAWSVWEGRKESRRVRQEYASRAPARAEQRHSIFRLIFLCGLILLGLALLVAGANHVVDSAVKVARLLGVQELIVGLTIVAVGTSLPEFVTSVVAAVRGARDIAVGNVVGSNIFNILGVLGISALVSPVPLSVPGSALWFDIPVMVVVAAASLPIFFSGHVISRWEGGVFFTYYVAYILWLVLDATQSAVTRTFGLVMVLFVIPLTTVTILVGVVRAIHAPMGKRGRG